MAIEGAPTAAELGKLRWRCRRGMRELDVLLTRYVDDQYCDASESHRAAFRQLLDSQDPLIYDYFLGRREAPSLELASLIARITAGRPNDQY
jgi:antitoxin CptB